MTQLDEEIEALKLKLAQAKKRKAKLAAAEKKKENEAKTARENRKKILIGACVLNLMQKDGTGEYAKTIIAALNMFLTRPDERELFGLPVLQPKE